MVVSLRKRATVAIGVVAAGLVLAACGSGKSSIGSTYFSAPDTAAPLVTPAVTCPAVYQANAALDASYSGPITSLVPGGGLSCEYAGAAGNAGVTIFARQGGAVFAGQVARASGSPTMPAISGLGDGAFGTTTAGRSIVNAYSNSRQTVVTAQAPGPLAPVEAFARLALADN